MERDAGKAELNANLAAHNANEKRLHVEQLNKEADPIEKNIALVAAEEAELRKGSDYAALTLALVAEPRTAGTIEIWGYSRSDPAVSMKWAGRSPRNLGCERGRRKTLGLLLSLLSSPE